MERYSAEGNRIRCAESGRSVHRWQLHQVVGRNIEPTSVLGASVTGSGVSSQLGLLYSSFVSEDSHSLMGGSDVVNSGLIGVLYTIAIHFMVLSGMYYICGHFGDKLC